jgi:hypothetical protein
MLAVLLVGATALTVDLISSPPLSTVSLHTATEGVISGPLVTLADGTWYLGGRHHRLLAIDVSQVRSAVVTANHSRHDPADENVIQLIFGRSWCPAGPRGRMRMLDDSVVARDAECSLVPVSPRLVWRVGLPGPLDCCYVHACQILSAS